MRLDELFERFIEDAIGRNVAGTTLAEYRAKWRLYVSPQIGNARVAQLKPIALSDLYAELRRTGGKGGAELGTRTVQHVATLIKTVLKWAYRKELIARVVSDFVDPPKGSRKKAVPYQQRSRDSHRRGDAGPQRADCRLRLPERATPRGALRAALGGLGRGARPGSHPWVHNPAHEESRPRARPRQETWYKPTKTDRVQTIALSEAALEARALQRKLQEEDKRAARGLYKDDGYVFAPPGGGYTTPGSLANAVRRIAVRAGLSTTALHATRHSAASFLLADGVDLGTVSTIMRHSAKSTTLNVYGHTLAGAQAEAIAHLSRRFSRSGGNRLATGEGLETEKTL